MTLLSKNKIKYLSSLQLKKFRDENRQFVAEGNKLVSDLLKKPGLEVILLAATSEWLQSNERICRQVSEVYEISKTDLPKVSSFETPSPVVAVLPYHTFQPDYRMLEKSVSLALDSIQDPGNLGTIIRTADWFGVENVFCNEACADRYNPKVIQASMGSVFNVRIHYSDIAELFQKIPPNNDFPVIGTYMDGEPVTELRGLQKGIVIFGNESKGISEQYGRFVTRRITIPAFNPNVYHVESLNVASSVAVTLGIIKLSAE